MSDIVGRSHRCNLLPCLGLSSPAYPCHVAFQIREAENRAASLEAHSKLSLAESQVGLV
jgi:hypothetical protein